MTPGPVRRILGGPGRLVRHLAALSESAKYVQYETDPPPCDAPHQTPRADPRTSAGQDLRAWAELLRVSALFTVPGDALAGAASAGVRPNRGTALAVATSLCLYEAGMALNDWADREEDARERPHRPIPSGRITPNAALAAAGGLTATGLFLASRAGRPALAVSTALAASVWAYDLRLKHTSAGPAAMGAARALDVLLGATATHAASRRTPIGRGVPTGPGRDSEAAHAASRRTSIGRGLPTGPGREPEATGRGVLARLSAWAGGSKSRRVSKPGPAWAPASEAAASTARFSAPPAGRDALTRLSAWADGSAGQGGTAPPAGGSVNRLTGSASEAAASTARFPSQGGGRGVFGRFSSPPAGRGVLAKFTGSASRSASEAGASSARFPSPPARRDALARLSAWVDGSSGQERAVPPVGSLASRLAGAVSEAAASTVRSSSPPAGLGVFGRLSAWAHSAAAWGGGPVESAAGFRRAGPASDRPGSPLPPAWGSGSAVPGRVSAWAEGSASGGSTARSGRQGRTTVWAGVPRGALVPAALLGVHTVAVTTVSRREVYGGAVGAPVAALVVTGVLGGVVGRPRDAGVVGLVTAALSAAYAVTAGRAFLHAALNPSPQLTQRAVGGGIRAMIPFQAALASRGGTPAVGLAVMGLVPLARKLAKKVSVT